jgi:hypothetical protein
MSVPAAAEAVPLRAKWQAYPRGPRRASLSKLPAGRLTNRRASEEGENGVVNLISWPRSQWGSRVPTQRVSASSQAVWMLMDAMMSRRTVAFILSADQSGLPMACVFAASPVSAQEFTSSPRVGSTMLDSLQRCLLSRSKHP